MYCVKQNPEKGQYATKTGFFLFLMSNIRRISDFQHQFCFSSRQEEFSIYFERFLASDLGKIYQGIPWDELVKCFGLKASVKGPDSIFSPRGKLALMFLKHYSCTSDKRYLKGQNLSF